MSDIWSQDMDCINRLVRKKFTVIGVNFSIWGTVFFCSLLSSFNHKVAESYKVNSLLLCHSREMLQLGNIPTADKSDFNVCHSLISFTFLLENEYCTVHTLCVFKLIFF